MRLGGRGKLELDGGGGGRRIPTEGWLVIVQSCWPCEAVFETEVAKRHRTKWSIDDAVDDRRGAAPEDMGGQEQKGNWKEEQSSSSGQRR